MFNRVILVGNLTRDCEIRYTNSGTAIAKTAIATSRKFTKDGQKHDETCFVDVTFFGKSAEVANQYLRKGSKVLIEGRLTLEQWEQDGQKRSKHSVTVENMQMLDGKNANNENKETSAQGGYQQQNANNYHPQTQMPASIQPVNENEIPF